MVYLYRQSFYEAKRCNELDLWRASFQENIRCTEAIDKIIKENFDGYRLHKECGNAILKEFGFDRTRWIIANTIQLRKGDGRFSQDNKKWADSVYIPDKDHRHSYELNSHSCCVDGISSQVMRSYNQLGLFNNTHIIPNSRTLDYTNQLLIISADSLSDGFKTPENQLFLAKTGFGCDPNANGRKVFGTFLNDGEETHFYRADFVGIIAEEHIPNWAKEQLEQIASNKLKQDSAPQVNINM